MAKTETRKPRNPDFLIEREVHRLWTQVTDWRQAIRWSVDHPSGDVCITGCPEIMEKRDGPLRGLRRGLCEYRMVSPEDALVGGQPEDPG